MNGRDPRRHFWHARRLVSKTSHSTNLRPSSQGFDSVQSEPSFVKIYGWSFFTVLARICGRLRRLLKENRPFSLRLAMPGAMGSPFPVWESSRPCTKYSSIWRHSCDNWHFYDESRIKLAWPDVDRCWPTNKPRLPDHYGRNTLKPISREKCKLLSLNLKLKDLDPTTI